MTDLSATSTKSLADWLSPPKSPLGTRLSAVTYRYLPPPDGSGYVAETEGVDGNLTAVSLRLSNGDSATLTWANRREVEGIALLVNCDSYAGSADRALDASSREAWREHIGETLESVAASWQISSNDRPETLWALRFNFEGGSVVVALGTDYPQIDYMPDELVVVFDPVLARAFHPPHVADSAWGDDFRTP